MSPLETIARAIILQDFFHCEGISLYLYFQLSLDSYFETYFDIINVFTLKSECIV